MDAVSKTLPIPARPRCGRCEAGADVVLDPPDARQRSRGADGRASPAGASRGRGSRRRSRRVLTPQGAAGPAPRAHRQPRRRDDRGGHARRRRHARGHVAERAVTLVRDDRAHVPLPTAAHAAACSTCRCSTIRRTGGSPRRAGRCIPELRKRWPSVTAVELSDHSTPEELELVRAMAASSRRGGDRGVRARGVGQRPARSVAGHRRSCCSDLSRGAARRKQPLVAAFFGSPYAAVGGAGAAGDARSPTTSATPRKPPRCGRWPARLR